MIPTGPQVRRRLMVLLMCFFVLFALLGIQLFRLQIVQGASLMARAQRQWTQESVIAPKRGAIYDRQGNVLAMSATAYVASVSPRQVSNAKEFARVLSPIINIEPDVIEKKASDRSKGGVMLKRQLSPETAGQIREIMSTHKAVGLGILNGLYLEQDAKRHYPFGDFAAQMLGLTTVDGVGQSGLEKSLNKYLSGRAGKVLDEVDGKGRAIADGSREYIQAVDGSDVTLTIDAAIQSIAEQAAREAITVNGAKAVRILVMDVNTGQILAMCSKPSFDPNEPPRSDVAALNELMRDRIIVDAYEPGSTFKILTMASALEAGVTHLNEGFYCSGSVTVDGGKIRCWGNPHGSESLSGALDNSCNPVFVELGLRLGVERFYDFMEGFGLGKPTGVDLSGESGGILISRSRCKRVDIARIGFGQSVAVTPLQLLSAACATVNGGRVMRPYVIEQITSPEGMVIERGQPKVMATPISEKTSRTMRTMLEGVVSHGGGRNAFLNSYRVGGKTGTAQLYINGVVSRDTHIGSFLGFAPMEDPQIGVLVIVDEAAIRPDFGSVTAAPFAKQIIERSLMSMGVAPNAGEMVKANRVTVPDVTGMDVSQALSKIKSEGLSGLLDGSGARVVGQLPAPGATMTEQSLVMLYVSGTPEQTADERMVVPDVTGLSIMEANRLIKSYGLTMKIDGSGIAVNQSPTAGETVTPTSTVTVHFAVAGTTY